MVFLHFRTLAAIFEFYMASQSPWNPLKTFREPVASFSQSLGPFRATAIPFMPKIITMKTCNIRQKCQQPHNTTYNPSKRSMDLKNPTNAHRKVSVFDIRLPQGSIFGNPDCAYLALGT